MLVDTPITAAMEMRTSHCTGPVCKSVWMAQFNVVPVSLAWTNHAAVRRASVDIKQLSVHQKIVFRTAMQRLCVA